MSKIDKKLYAEFKLMLEMCIDGNWTDAERSLAENGFSVSTLIECMEHLRFEDCHIGDSEIIRYYKKLLLLISDIKISSE